LKRIPPSNNLVNPDNGITKFIAELLSNPRPGGSVVIAAEKVKNLLLLLGIGKLTKSTNNINLRLDSIEKAIKAVSVPSVVPVSVHPLPHAPPNGWSNVVKKNSQQCIHACCTPFASCKPSNK
jgi:hypothetical protein